MLMSSPSRRTHLVRDVERHGLVRDLHVGNLHHDLLELIVVPVGQTLHHRQRSVVGLICAGQRSVRVTRIGALRLTVDDVEEDELWPEVRLLRRLDHLGLTRVSNPWPGASLRSSFQTTHNVDTLPEQLEVLHD